MWRIGLLRLSQPMLLSVSPAADADLSAITELLAANGLPTADVGGDSRPEFFVARQGRQLVGVVGLERFGDSGLLRSLAVSAEHRRSGVGIQLTHAVEERAAQAGLKSLVLLTETAAGFFERRGYRAIAHAEAPAAVQASTEFRMLCPASAVCMIRSLELGRT